MTRKTLESKGMKFSSGGIRARWRMPTGSRSPLSLSNWLTGVRGSQDVAPHAWDTPQMGGWIMLGRHRVWASISTGWEGSYLEYLCCRGLGVKF